MRLSIQHFLISAFFLSLLSTSASATIIYEDAVIPGNNGNRAITFSADNLGAHDSISLNFDLFIMDSWDGHRSQHNDTFGIQVNGRTVFSATFSNFYPLSTWETNTETATATGNFNNINYWGAIDRYFDDYAGGFTFAHTGSTLDITFFGSGLQSTSDESWRVSDIDIVANVTAVPVPASFPLMALGLLGVLASRRISKCQ